MKTSMREAVRKVNHYLFLSPNGFATMEEEKHSQHNGFRVLHHPTLKLGSRMVKNSKAIMFWMDVSSSIRANPWVTGMQNVWLSALDTPDGLICNLHFQFLFFPGSWSVILVSSHVKIQVSHSSSSEEQELRKFRYSHIRPSDVYNTIDV
jgi:hypothetical protein